MVKILLKSWYIRSSSPLKLMRRYINISICWIVDPQPGIQTPEEIDDAVESVTRIIHLGTNLATQAVNEARRII